MTDEPVYAQFGFTDAEWGLISGLPQSVLTAASAAEADGTRRTRAEAAAGLDRISDGRQSASPLVSAVAAELITRVGDPERGEELAVPEPPDPRGYAADVLGRAGEAAALLAAKVSEGEAGAYKHWLVEIAEDVVTASSTGGAFGLGGETVTEQERSFRDRLSRVLTD
ncbi:hypothetical protein [Spirilliplanes yamanashiensis]|uniref:Uncharacterized protein n=1 Tax=Spirilliplanes yamanashiensis TaxID=42233 RepID=A0A8J4DLA1_9ACTN|nr:hypothetical protein [Spirilliplanes yamanashiensis]MDP9818718.1 hypothetical protein [Spirilliplanes yamanashiensis]GIJ05173.1 hypothetical protein Sya03_45250 [Spirilliplanes yamanashiensis]